MARNLEGLKAAVVRSKTMRGAVLSAHEKRLYELLEELIGHLEFLPDHTHHMTSGNSLRTEGPEDMR